MKITSNNDAIASQLQLSSHPLNNGKQPAETPTRLSSTSAQADKVVLSEAARQAGHSEPLPEVAPHKAFIGNDTVLIQPESETTQRMEAILNRLSEDEQKDLIDSKLLTEDKFLQLAEELSDEELKQFVAITTALETPPKRNGFNPIMPGGHQETLSLVDRLSAMDQSTRSRVLEKADGYADKVYKPAPSSSYQPDGTFAFLQPSESANDLHNLIGAVGRSDDVDGMLDQLELFEESDQSSLLGLLHADIGLGGRMMDQLEGRNKESQSAVLDFVSQISSNISGYAPELQTTTGATSPGERAFALLGHDNGSSQVAFGMIEDTVSLMENYRFDDAQLKQMGDQLRHMERGDQRAYLAITETGLDNLLGGNEGKGAQIDLSEHEEVFEQIDSLRNDRQVRQLVFESRMGQEELIDGRRFYELKGQGESERDQQQMIKFLTTDAWLNREVDNSSAHDSQTRRLTSQLSELGAEQRDQLVESLNRLAQSEHPMAELSEPALEEVYGAFFDRTTSIANTDDLGALLNAEADTQQALRESFWQATELAGEQVDDLVKLLDNSAPELREQIIITLSEESALIDAKEKDRDSSEEELSKLISYFEKDHTEAEKQRYLEGAF
ncbi:hypothetical protein [Marinobacterium jannaschii]|uniref:hypothetical protein n=1 Tax=Marinobacterium jannaschii TaxID=64970 RepID=UPI0006876633|nr:hypothetical protein [Marinobacterium jannaschii]